MDDDWITLSALEHHAYCPWQAQLLQDGVWADNHLTVQGTASHKRVDTPGVDSRRGIKAHHRVPVASRRLRIHGVADSVEEGRDGALVPVEHKWGRGAGDLRPMILQVVGQALCLEEMCGLQIRTAVVYVVEERRREVFSVEEWRLQTEGSIQAARRALIAQVTAPPDYDAKLCGRCSLLGACQPCREEGS